MTNRQVDQLITRQVEERVAQARAAELETPPPPPTREPITLVRRVVERHQYAALKWTPAGVQDVRTTDERSADFILDAFTANACQTVHDNLKPANQVKTNAMMAESPARFMQFARFAVSQVTLT